MGLKSHVFWLGDVKVNKPIEDALKLKIPDSCSATSTEVDNCAWTTIDGIVLTRRDKEKISQGEMLV